MRFDQNDFLPYWGKMKKVYKNVSALEKKCSFLSSYLLKTTTVVLHELLLFYYLCVHGGYLVEDCNVGAAG